MKKRKSKMKSLLMPRVWRVTRRPPLAVLWYDGTFSSCVRFLVFFSVHTPPDPFSYYSKLVLINHYICAISLNVPFFLISRAWSLLPIDSNIVDPFLSCSLPLILWQCLQFLASHAILCFLSLLSVRSAPPLFSRSLLPLFESWSSLPLFESWVVPSPSKVTWSSLSSFRSLVVPSSLCFVVSLLLSSSELVVPTLLGW